MYLPPYGALVAPVAPDTPQGVVHGPRLEVPEREVWATSPWGESPRTVAPPPALDARDWQREIAAGSNQNAGVHHAVLSCADELVSLQDQDSQASSFTTRSSGTLPA